VPDLILRKITPVEPLADLAPGLWVQREDLSHPLYGGNKPRKLWPILAEARRRGATGLLTFGAAGSHHVLATGIFGREAGLGVTAVLVPQRRSEHAVETLRAALTQGVEPILLRGPRGAARALLAGLGRGRVVVPVGGSSVRGVRGAMDAVEGLARSVREGQLPCPDWVVVATGSGGTAAALAVGLVRAGLRSRVLAVVVGPAAGIRLATRQLTLRVALACGVSPRAALARLAFTADFVGGGYGHPTPAGEEATSLAASAGLTLDPTYTAKAFAAALGLARGGAGTVLFWHTLSSAPLGPLLAGAPPLPPALDALFF
jgi:1-aminocyclopropane-1-carboxylate deaminase/D-cysteine desulfhydrase-like pyridoxal-dependent ACC family enzyme